MRKVIDGKRYDTETAEQVCDVSGPHSCDRGNFRWDDTYLYRTPRGRWFLAGRGGPMSRWASYNCNTYGSGSGLNAIDADEAREFVERYGTVEDSEKYFTVEEA